MRAPSVKRLHTAVLRLVAASVDDAYKGAAYPEDVEVIEEELAQATASYERQMKKLADYLKGKQHG